MMCSEAVYAVEGSEEAGSANHNDSGNALVGSPFIGTVTSVEGRVSGLTVSVIVGTSVGEVVGTITIDRRGRASRRYPFKGAVNARGLFVWHGIAEDGSRAVLTGTVDRAGNTLGGKYMSQEAGGLLEVGTFLAGRT